MQMELGLGQREDKWHGGAGIQPEKSEARSQIEEVTSYPSTNDSNFCILTSDF
jgi:hypothetical protein